MPASSTSFPILDIVGPADPGVVLPDTGVVAEVIAPNAREADTGGVSRAALDALAGAGLLGSPLADPMAQRELSELIAGSDASTWFCWAQHQTPLRILEEAAGADDLRAELLPGMRRGEIVGAVAFAHVRRPGPPNPTATCVPGGWRLSGTLDWVTSWDIADVVMVMAQGSVDDVDRLVCVFLPAGRSARLLPGMEVGAPLDLLAMSGTHTRPLRLDDVFVPDGRTGAVLDRAAWREQDAVRSADASPAAFGVARGAIAELDGLAARRGDARLKEVAGLLADECREVRARAYEAADGHRSVDRRLRLRAASLDLAARAATAVIVASSGASMRRGAPAERRLREAMFLQVQAQTAATRAQSLMLVAEGSRSALTRLAGTLDPDGA